MTQATFEKVKAIFIADLKENNQTLQVIHNCEKATSFQGLKSAIDSYWGWENEQTVWLLEKAINEL